MISRRQFLKRTGALIATLTATKIPFIKTEKRKSMSSSPSCGSIYKFKCNSRIRVGDCVTLNSNGKVSSFNRRKIQHIIGFATSNSERTEDGKYSMVDVVPYNGG